MEIATPNAETHAVAPTQTIVILVQTLKMANFVLWSAPTLNTLRTEFAQLAMMLVTAAWDQETPSLQMDALIAITL